MKFTVEREKLQRALAQVSSIIGSRSMLPLLGNVLIEAENDRLTLTATDLELRLTTDIEAKVEESGRTTLPGRKLVSLTGALAGDEVTFDINELDQARISCGTGRFRLVGMAAADFPAGAEFEPIREIKIDEGEFKRMIQKISYAVSADDSRKVLTGILASFHDEAALTLVGTDGKRMAMCDATVESSSPSTDGEAIISLKTMLEAKKLLEAGRTMTLELGEKQCRFVIGDFVLSSRLIDGNYPNYRQVIPKSCKFEIDLPVAAFLAKLETVSLILSENSSFVVLSLENGKMRISGASSEVGEGSDELEIEYSGEPFEVSFNPAFLVDPLRIIDSETIKLKFNEPINPVTMSSGEGFLYVIMPIRKQ